MEIGCEIEIRIDDMLDDGRAFGRHEGCAVFVNGGCGMSDGGSVAGAVTGDVARVEIKKIRKNSAEAVLKSIARKSPDRIEAECPYFGECGGCTLQELSYDAQLELKREQLKSKLERLGGLDSPRVNECIPAEALKYYRNKATFSVGPHGEVGFMKGKSHFVMDVEDCMLQSDAAMVCADALRSFLKTHVDEGDAFAKGKTYKGKKKGKTAARKPLGITQMAVRTAFGTGEVMVVLESDRKEIPDIELLIEMLDDAVYSLNLTEMPADADEETTAGSIQSGARTGYSLESVALIYGAGSGGGKQGKCEILAGKPTITEVISMSMDKSSSFGITGGYDHNIIRYEISPQSFFQVNPEQMTNLYDKVTEYSGLGEDKRLEDKSENAAKDRERKGAAAKHTILDIYCGTGSIGIWLLKKLGLKLKEHESIKSDADVTDLGDNVIGAVPADIRLIGIESVKPAVVDANRNSVINGLISTRYICGKAEEELPGMMGLTKLYKWNEINERVEREPEIRITVSEKDRSDDGGGKITTGNKSVRTDNTGDASNVIIEKIDAAILDPPRAGCGEALLAAVCAAAPGRIVYVSCDPGTLARDVKYLTSHGYEFIEATPVDMFPWTSSIEVVTKLQRRKS